ncbi:unnamed protein product [Soboliphyme baturini]|uniref:Derlin n=1 Tax=Soboliphyme baturini TaxID=241478 RepID=A0A183IQA0_9BILA|nr:unnamed protein product [Soboliphyme baturini]
MADSDLAAWFQRIPHITKYWFTGSVVLPLAARFGLVNPYYLILVYELIKKFQLWRPVTALFYYPITPQTGFQYLIMIYFLYSYSLRLETGIFDGRPADYLCMLLFNWAAIVLIALFVNLHVLLEPMVLSVLYVWCQANKDVVVQFWFGTQFKAMYLPWVLAVFNMILHGGIANELTGIVVGHLYFFLAFKYPQEFGGPSLLHTPQFL